MKKDSDDFGAYEIFLMDSFDIEKFNHDVKGGKNNLWLVNTEAADNFYRYHGVKLPEYRRVILDIDVDNRVAYSPESLDLVKELYGILGGTKLLKDGVEVYL